MGRIMSAIILLSLFGLDLIFLLEIKIVVVCCKKIFMEKNKKKMVRIFLWKLLIKIKKYIKIY